MTVVIHSLQMMIIMRIYSGHTRVILGKFMYKWSLGVGTNIQQVNHITWMSWRLTLIHLNLCRSICLQGITFVHAPSIARNGFSLALNPQNKQIRLINEQTRRVTSIFGGGEYSLIIIHHQWFIISGDSEKTHWFLKSCHFNIFHLILLKLYS